MSCWIGTRWCATAGRAQAVIIGFGRLGRAVLREIARRPRLDGAPFSVTVRGPSQETVSDFLNLFPAIRESCSVTCESDAPRPPGGEELTHTFVCLSGNDEALNAGLAAAHSMTVGSGQVVICMSEPSPFGPVLSGKTALLDDVRGRLSIFEVIEEACMPARIKEDLFDQLARAIHRAYVDNCVARGDSPEVNRSMRPWAELPDDLKRANLAQAMHIGTKLEAIDCVVTPESVTAPAFAFTEGEIEQLAQMEHERWMQERRRPAGTPTGRSSRTAGPGPTARRRPGPPATARPPR